MQRYWIATSQSHNSGKKGTKDEAVAWATTFLAKPNNGAGEVFIAEIYEVVKRADPPIISEPLYHDEFQPQRKTAA